MTDQTNREPPNQALYAGNEKIYPREVKGLFQNLRNYTVVILLGLYYSVPWFQWAERQAVLFDLPARKFYILGMTFWPQDFFFLSLLLILAGLSLFFFTALAGRVWCGYACPQTVWTEAFIWIERWVEGSRAQQMKLSSMPWGATKIRKRVTKQFLWLSFAFLTGLTFVGYFMPIRTLVDDLISLEIAGWSLFWVVFYGFATYGNAGFLREQVCKYMCPYARFQSAMFDKDTLIIAYDTDRGEPRRKGKRLKDQPLGTSGDCIDCGLCVQVCPTGIDIREGLQQECIACAACIDVCDGVMDKVNLDRGLIRYSSESHDAGEQVSLVKSLTRPRILIYGGLLGLIIVGFITAISMRSEFQVDVLRDRNALYHLTNQGDVENYYQVKVMNKGQITQSYSVIVEGLQGATVEWGATSTDGLSRELGSGQIGDFTAVVSVPKQTTLKRSQELTLTFTSTAGQTPASVSEIARFLAPSK